MKEQLKISGMNCQHCVMAVKKELSKLNLISSEVNIGEAIVEYDETLANKEQIKQAISAAGFELIE